MTTIVTRAGNGAPLSAVQVDANFTNLNTDKLEKLLTGYPGVSPLAGSDLLPVVQSSIAKAASVNEVAIAVEKYLTTLGAITPFTPASLFASSEVGCWYDPRDRTTLYQNSTATTSVSAYDQSVGCILDKSAGLVLGSERVTTGDFSSSTGWTLGSGWAITGGQLVGSAGAGTSATNVGTVTAGKWYLVSATISLTSGSVSMNLGSTGTALSSSVTYSSQLFRATATGAIAFQHRGAGFTGTIDNVSVKELPGLHAIQATSGVRPTYKSGPDRLYFDADPDSLTVSFATAPGDCTVVYGVAGGSPVITYPVNISTTTYTLNPTNTGSNLTGLVIINRALTAAETTKLTAWMGARA